MEFLWFKVDNHNKIEGITIRKPRGAIAKKEKKSERKKRNRKKRKEIGKKEKKSERKNSNREKRKEIRKKESKSRKKNSSSDHKKITQPTLCIMKKKLNSP